MLAALGARPTIRAIRGVIAERAWRDAGVVLAFGVTLGVMNFSIYQAMARIPLGIAVTIEFLGPLAVAIASSRRLIDVVWVLLAGTGVTLLGTAGVSVAKVGGTGAAVRLALGRDRGPVRPRRGRLVGLLHHAVGGHGQAVQRLVRTCHRDGAWPRSWSPRSPWSARAARCSSPAVLGTGLAIGLLSSVIPYRFELETLRRVSARVFGIWMSLEPAVAALVGVVLLSQALSVPQWIAIGCVVVASAGAALGENRSATAPQA